MSRLKIALCITLFCTQACEAAITIHPVLHVARPNEVVYFICTVESDPTDPGASCPDLNVRVTLTSDEEQHIDFSQTQLCDDCCGYKVAFVAQFNDTVVSCRGSYDPDSTLAYLYIADRPASPSPRIVSNGATTVQLQWEKPVTWTSTYDVAYYELRMYNSSSGEWREWVIPSRDNVTYSDDALTLQTFSSVEGVAMDSRDAVSVVVSARHVPRECDELVFYVSAGNEIGKSDSRALKATLHTAPVQWHADSLKLDPICKADGTACILATIAVPKMCVHYQSLINYSIVFNWTLGIKTIILCDRGEDEIIYLASLDGFPRDGVYSVAVSVSADMLSDSLAGVASGLVQAGCGITMLIDESHFCDLYPIIPGCICFILMLLTFIIMGALLQKEKGMKRRTRRAVHHEENVNPLYTQASEMKGHIYEYVAKFQQEPPAK